MFLKPYTITDFGKNIIVLPEDVIYKEVEGITNKDVDIYISNLFKTFSTEIAVATYYQVIVWASEGHLNADVWTFDLKSWNYNTEINVRNFTNMEIDTSYSIVTNRDGLLLLAENEKRRLQFTNINDFISSYSS